MTKEQRLQGKQFFQELLDSFYADENTHTRISELQQQVKDQQALIDQLQIKVDHQSGVLDTQQKRIGEKSDQLSDMRYDRHKLQDKLNDANEYIQILEESIGKQND